MKNLKEFMVNEAYDQFGSNMQIGDDVIFYYEDGIAEKDNNDNAKTPRLYKGTLRSWDKHKLEGEVETKQFDQDHYNIPKKVKVNQRLLMKIGR